MKRTYYTLFIRDSETGDWSPQFGDYDLQTVRDEKQDYRDNGVKARDCKIIESKPDQVVIDRITDHLNRFETGSKGYTNAEHHKGARLTESELDKLIRGLSK